jgi:glutamate--cysteine ligase catalytic subunit
MDIMLTDFENSAMVIVVGMVVNLINDFDVNFLMPISLNDENMDRAHKRDGLINQKFWVRKNIIKQGSTDYKTNTLEQSNWTKSSSES